MLSHCEFWIPRLLLPTFLFILDFVKLHLASLLVTAGTAPGSMGCT